MEPQQLLQQVWLAIRHKDLKKAIVASNQLNLEFPDFASGWHAASHLAQMINQPRKALLAIDRALKLESGRADWHLHRAACLLKCADLEAARSLLSRLVTESIGAGLDDSAYLTQLGFLCNQAEMHTEAEKLYRRLSQIEPENGSHWYNLATIQRFKGETTAAEASLQRAIALNPGDYEAYELRADLRKQTKNSNHVSELEALLEKGIETPAGEVKVLYALAKELEDIGEYARSFKALKRGARVRRKHINYRVADDLQTIDAIQSAFDAGQFERGLRGHHSNEPIFIVGLPRTGTTLLERILGSHSDVQAAGELPNFAVQMMQQLRKQAGKQNLSRDQLVQQSADLDFERLGSAYIESTRPMTGQAPRFVDKLPLNFLYVGLIRLALPKAKIIHVSRDPMDACYAIYKRLFQDAYPWSYKLEEIGRYYLAYRRLMAHWNEVLPGAIHQVTYEELVSDTEAQAQQLLEFCDLPWQQQCLRYYEQPQATTTASASQVRRPVYRSSIGLWRKYEEQLAPLAQIFRAQGIRFDSA
jgi:tetratricopeptide (TPR) repeat protein